MSKFCTSCGTQLEDESKFCSSCGAPQGQNVTPVPPDSSVTAEAPETTEIPSYSESPVMVETKAEPDLQPETTYPKPQLTSTVPVVKNDNTAKVGMVAVAVVAVIVIVLIAKLFGGSYKTPIINMCEAIEDCDWKKFSSTLPKEEASEIKEYFDFFGVDDGDEYMKDVLYDDLKDKYGKNIRISVDFKDKEKLDKDDIEDIEENFDDMYDEKINISKAYEVECEFTIKGKDDKDTDETTMTVGKIGTKWYVIDGGFAMG